MWDNEVQGDGGNKQTCDKMLNVELTKIEKNLMAWLACHIWNLPDMGI